MAHKFYLQGSVISRFLHALLRAKVWAEKAKQQLLGEANCSGYFFSLRVGWLLAFLVAVACTTNFKKKRKSWRNALLGWASSQGSGPGKHMFVKSLMPDSPCCMRILLLRILRILSATGTGAMEVRKKLCDQVYSLAIQPGAGNISLLRCHLHKSKAISPQLLSILFPMDFVLLPWNH